MMAFYFPEEIILDILLRLPANDLWKIKTVCKHWYSLISDSNFQKAHLCSFSSTQQDIILSVLPKNSINFHKRYTILGEKFLSINMQHKNIRVDDFYFNFPIHWKLSSILASSCNGLLLVLDEYEMLYVYNVVTRKYWVVPWPANYYCNNGCRCSSWSLSYHDWTLFYDGSVGKYKVCGIGRDKCILITVGENDWDEIVLSDKQRRLSPPIYLDKEIHWLISDRPANYHQYHYRGHDDFREYFVISMEVVTKLLRKTKAPILQCKDNCHYIVSEVKGSLCLVSASSDQIDVFVLEDRVESMWTKYYSTSLQALRNIPISLTSFVSNDVCLVAMRDIEGCDFSDLVKVFKSHEDKLIYYDLKREESKEIATLSKQEHLREFYHHYSGSFVSW